MAKRPVLFLACASQVRPAVIEICPSSSTGTKGWGAKVKIEEQYVYEYLEEPLCGSFLDGFI